MNEYIKFNFRDPPMDNWHHSVFMATLTYLAFCCAHGTRDKTIVHDMASSIFSSHITKLICGNYYIKPAVVPAFLNTNNVSAPEMSGT